MFGCDVRLDKRQVFEVERTEYMAAAWGLEPKWQMKTPIKGLIWRPARYALLLREHAMGADEFSTWLFGVFAYANHLSARIATRASHQEKIRERVNRRS